MYLQSKIRAQLFLVIGVTLFWMASGAFMAFYKCVNYIPASDEFIFVVPNQLSFGSFLLINIIGPAVGGFIGGSILIFRLSENLRKRSYWYYVFVNFWFFLGFILVLNTIIPYWFYYREEIHSANDPLAMALDLLILDPYALRNIVTWLVIAWITVQGLNIYEKYAPTTLISLFLGRYHRPHEVSRIFMFLDLSDSTTIAERLGHIHFFDLLKDFFSDMTDPILDTQGEIYQYIGDEIVVSWPVRRSVLKHMQPLECFFRIEKSVQNKEAYYLEKYGLLPKFKAAFHSGEVVVGEIGVIKREIVYSGDILNTTSRMMEQCKVYKQKLIISNELLEKLPENELDKYCLAELGEMGLRGKTKKMILYGIS
ncbi:adenylate/guanylate cyclase domain-containing protein [Gramella jeungdoensis]|uniref:Adenylate/guanylate cyclase domain-containing protein n=1 Tax=Gramella jeungdoensis TaxID=708091 RepID=A0ABT0Z6R9_9FLAO|nr:adenylate/guanylate cyclase domain-containing protein [Gramella jeungdoensis]MCM8571123.1 adenylate/guanylate cyclase domain-containing protein [Gramella jeungdoensis]